MSTTSAKTRSQYIELGAVGAAGLRLYMPDHGEVPLHRVQQVALRAALQHLAEEKSTGRKDLDGECQCCLALQRRTGIRLGSVVSWHGRLLDFIASGTTTIPLRFAFGSAGDARRPAGAGSVLAEADS